jgi:hypothetical protein
VYRGHRSLPFRLRKVLRNKIAARRFPNLVFTRLLPFWHALQTWRQSMAVVVTQGGELFAASLLYNYTNSL